MYASVKGDNVLPVTSDSGTYEVQGGIRTLDKLREVPYVMSLRSEAPTVSTLRSFA
jgi:hypothetical protein